MVVVEGVARSLNPQINIWQVARPVVEDYIKKTIGPRAALRDLGRTAAILSRYGPRLPQLVEAALIRQSNAPEPDTRTPWQARLGYGAIGAVCGVGGVMAVLALS
jgi:ubiquinone biosynthesis protein